MADDTYIKKNVIVASHLRYLNGVDEEMPRLLREFLSTKHSAVMNVIKRIFDGVLRRVCCLYN